MIQFRKDLNYNLYRQKLLGGNVAGIWDKNSFFLGMNSFPVMRYHYITAQFNNFEKNIFKQGLKINYHLSGYGIGFNEALTSFLGESTERYAFTLLYKNIEHLVEIASYQELLEKYPEEKILPLELVNVYFDKKSKDNYILPSDVIQWISLISLYDTTQRVYVPLQMFILFEQGIFKNEKQYLNSAVSTGTASHENFENSLKNSIIEDLQIDSYNLWWYGGIKGDEIEIDIRQKLKQWFEEVNLIDKFLRKFKITFTDISFDKSIYVLVCEIESKSKSAPLPQYIVGVQGGLNFEKCIYRSFLECVTVLEYAMTVVWNDKEHFKSIPKDLKSFSIDNLDDNVLYYAKYGKNNVRKERTLRFTKEIKSDSLSEVIKSLSKLSEYACFLEITPIEFYEKNFCITRVITPELLPISLPSYPPYFHPRYKNFGGIFNHVPHPMA